MREHGMSTAPRVMVGPAPDGGEVTLSVDCFVDREHGVGKRHPITVRADWSVLTPHDLKAERIGVGFGGYLSCLGLVEHVVPAAAVYLRRQLRGEAPAMFRGVNGRWVAATRVERCCAATMSWRSPQEAANHLRRPQHVAAEVGGTAAAVASLGEVLLRAWNASSPVRLPGAAHALVGSRVSSTTAAAQLWESGLSPYWISWVHAQVEAAAPLSVPFYLGVMARRPDLTWVRDTVRRSPNRADHGWLAWTETALDRADPSRRSCWLATGATRRDIASLSGSSYAPEDVRRLAELLGVSGTDAASTLASWVGTGCAAAVEQVAVMGAQPGAGRDEGSSHA